MTKLVAVLAICIVAPLVLGRVKGAIFNISVFAFLFPRTLHELNSVPLGTFGDLSTPNLTITSYTIAVAVALIGIFTAPPEHRTSRLPRAFWAVIIGSFALLFYVWAPDSESWSGMIAVLTGIGAWAAGSFVGRELFDDVDITRFTAKLFSLILMIELAVEVLEYRRIHLPEQLTSTGRVTTADAGRVFGTIGHPANLSKIAFMMVVVLLVLALSSDRITRKYAYIGVTLAIPVVGMTVSRANTVALVSLLVFWAFFASRGIPSTLRTIIVIGVGVGLGVFFQQFDSRIAEDPNGGARPELLSAGIEQLWRSPYTGTGPNRYIDVVSKFSADTALGYPVHNVFLFTACSIGIPLAILMFIPHVQLIVRSMRARKQDPAALVVLMAAPGMLVILLTGWAMMSMFLLVTWFFVAGAFFARISGQSSLSDDRTVEGETSHVRVTQRSL